MTLDSARWQHFLGRFAGVCVIAGTVPTGCGAPVAECALDSDCDQGQACERSQCVSVCGTDAECLPGEVCLKGTTTDLRICQSEAAATSDGDPVDVHAVLVQDASETCDSMQPGADIAFVLLEDHAGAVVGWGAVIDGSTAGAANLYGSWDHIDGDRPDAGADSCPPWAAESVVSLGCDGFVVVEFRDSAGAVIAIDAGSHRLRVGELGAQCEDVEDDAYDVFLCTEPTSAEDVATACSVPVGTGNGERSFEL